MSEEQETKRLLQFKETMEQRMAELEAEAADLRAAMAAIDKMIVAEGFRTPTAPKAAPQPKPRTETPQPTPQAETLQPESFEEGMSITSKDGTVLGRMNVEGKDLLFEPQPEYEFKTDIPPFQSFLVERVLANMSSTDRERAANGEIDQSEILEYEVKEEDGVLKELHVRNYGGERRLREINSSLRWTFDKMYDKIRQG
ncbi:hypothetical protein KAT55_03540 [Candidatus Bathyarchaeota archaeon]|nr:hypothetical protein [Candidatus Bathyarchaeota archaeon]